MQTYLNFDYPGAGFLTEQIQASCSCPFFLSLHPLAVDLCEGKRRDPSLLPTTLSSSRLDQGRGDTAGVASSPEVTRTLEQIVFCWKKGKEKQ